MTPPARDQFIQDHEHVLFGMILDAATDGRKGAELSVWVRMIASKIRTELGRCYDDLIPPPPVPVKPPAPTPGNGQPAGHKPAQPTRK